MTESARDKDEAASASRGRAVLRNKGASGAFDNPLRLRDPPTPAVAHKRGRVR